MRQSTSNRAGDSVGAANPAMASGPGGWSATDVAPALKEAAEASTRWWMMFGAGFGVLGFLALGGLVFQAFSSPSPESQCLDGPSCNAAAVSYAEAVDASDEELATAARLFQRGCDLGHAPACNNLGLAHEGARGIPQDYARAMMAFERACSLGFAEGCSNQGTMQEHGLGVPANLGDAQRSYSLACRRGSALGCSNLGVLYAEGRGVEPDETMAARLFAESCRAGSEIGCANLFASEQRTPQTRPASSSEN